MKKISIAFMRPVATRIDLECEVHAQYGTDNEITDLLFDIEQAINKNGNMRAHIFCDE